MNPDRPVSHRAPVAAATRRAQRNPVRARSLAAAFACLPALALATGVLDGATAPPALRETLAWWTAIGWWALAGVGLVAVGLAAGALGGRRRNRGNAPGWIDTTAPTDLLLASLPGEPAPPPREARRPAAPAEDPAPTGPAPASAVERFCLPLHHVERAIGALRDHVETSPRPMPVAWLMLLDLYRTHGREQAFDELAARFHARFNAALPEWGRYPPAPDSPGLEAFPRLIREITQCWGTHECRRLLDRLLHDNRNGRRMGFTINAYKDLLALRALADSLLASIEADFAEEAALRTAFAAASTDARETSSVDATPPRAPARESAMVHELRAELEGDLRDGGDDRSALEIEHPALAGMLAREWSDPALAARLCAVLARPGAGAPALSAEAAEELAFLRDVALAVAAGRTAARASAAPEQPLFAIGSTAAAD